MQISYRKQALLSIRGQISCKGKVFPDLRWWSYPVINLEIQTLRHHRIRLILTIYDNMSKYDEIFPTGICRKKRIRYRLIGTTHYTTFSQFKIYLPPNINYCHIMKSINFLTLITAKGRLFKS